MKRTYLIGKILLGGLFLIGISQACTNLNEQLYDQVTPESFLKGQDQFVSALGSAYRSLSGYATGSIWELQEVSTDELTCPTRGQNWDDGGEHRRVFEHNVNREDPEVIGSWQFIYAGVNNCNRNIDLFNGLVSKGQVDASLAASYIAELKVLREFFYYLALNDFGNVPVVTSFASAPAQPATVKEKDVYTFIVNSLKENVPLLTRTKGGSAYGRMNYWAGRMLQAKLYQNAEVYTGTADWDDCIAMCDTIINGGGFDLESDFFANFSAANTGTNEMIFAIPYDQVFFTGFNMSMSTLHYGNQDTYNLTSQPWNGYCTLEEFYNSFEDKDIRKGDMGTLDGPAKKKGSFVAGYQFKADGVTPLNYAGYEKQDPNNPDIPYDHYGPLVNLDPHLSELGPNEIAGAGARVGKWEFALGGTPDMSNDYAVFRYSDVLLMKAEAIWRKSGNSTDGTALALVNQVRARAGVDALTTLDGPVNFDMSGPSVAGGELFNERGRELFDEQHRRMDLLRWGLFTKADPTGNMLAWGLPVFEVGDKYNLANYTVLNPIPRAEIESDPNLQQNPGY